MNGDTLKAHYDRLTTAERLRLVLAATARGDGVDLQDLRRTCPKADLPTMRHEMTALELAVHKFAVVWLERSRAFEIAQGLQIARWLQEPIRREVTAADSDVKRPPSYPAAQVPDWLEGSPIKDLMLGEDPTALETMVSELRRDLKSTHQGFLLFCESLGLEPDLVLALLPALASDIASMAWILQDPATVVGPFAGDVEDGLLAVWRLA